MKKHHRRTFLGTAGFGAMSFALPPAFAQEQATESAKANQAVVNKFLHLRWNATPIDYEALGKLLAEDCVRGAADPTGNLEKGRDTILASLKRRAGDGAPTRFTYLYSSGPPVRSSCTSGTRETAASAATASQPASIMGSASFTSKTA